MKTLFWILIASLFLMIASTSCSEANHNTSTIVDSAEQTTVLSPQGCILISQIVKTMTELYIGNTPQRQLLTTAINANKGMDDFNKWPSELKVLTKLTAIAVVKRAHDEVLAAVATPQGNFVAFQQLCLKHKGKVSEMNDQLRTFLHIYEHSI